MSLFVAKGISDTLEIDSRVRNDQALAQRGQRTHQYVSGDVTPGFEFCDGLALATHALGQPRLGPAAGSPLGSQPLPEFTRIQCDSRHV
jgi:hypothetical protein